MKILKKPGGIALGIVAAGFVMALSGCPSPMLARVQQEVARSRAIDTTYSFLRQWGNPNPLYTFTDPIVKVDTAGYFYVTDGSFRVIKYSYIDGSVLRAFSVAGANFSNGVTDMAFDAGGNMYITTTQNRVQKYNLSGTLVLDFGGFGTGNGQFSDPEGIVIDGSGNILVADSGHNRIQKFDASGNYLDQWDGTGKNGTGTAFSAPAGMVVDGSGNIYVVDTGNSRVVKFSSVGNYVGTYGTYGTGASSVSATYFNYPQGIARDSSGNFYVVDSGNDRVQQFDSSFAWLTTWGSTGTGNGQFSYPRSAGVDSSGNIYVSDSLATNRGRIEKFSAPGVWVATFGGDTRTANGYVNMSTGLAYDSSGNSWVIDNLNQRVQEFGPNGNYLATAGTGTAGSANGQFSFDSFPITPACDASGNLYVPDKANNRIQKFNSSGGFLSVFVPNGTLQGQVKSPTALAFDSAGNLYIADMGNSRIQVVDSNGYWVKQWAWSGSPGGALGIAVDKSGNVYVSDYQLNRVQKFDASGNLVTQWGSLGSGDGQFSAPIGVAVDSQGYVYVVDMFNTRVQKFDSSGNFIQKFGTAGMGSGGFGWPVGIAINSTGQIAVSDYRGCLIQEFNPVPPSY